MLIFSNLNLIKNKIIKLKNYLCTFNAVYTLNHSLILRFIKTKDRCQNSSVTATRTETFFFCKKYFNILKKKYRIKPLLTFV